MGKYEEALDQFYRTMTSENPALIPDPPQPVEKTYKVVGTQAVLDHRPGEEFTATLPFDQEESYLTYGHLAVVEDQVSTETQSQQGTGDASISDEGGSPAAKK